MGVERTHLQGAVVHKGMQAVIFPGFTFQVGHCFLLDGDIVVIRYVGPEGWAFFTTATFGECMTFYWCKVSCWVRSKCQ